MSRRSIPENLAPLTDAELERLWSRYEEAADEGWLSARGPFERDITPREFRRLLLEVEVLRLQHEAA